MSRTKSRDDESYEEVVRRAQGHLSLLIQLASAEAIAERGGTRPDIDRAAWGGIEELLLTTLRDVQRLHGELANLHNGRAMAIAGGAR
jgi:hypothetical protein